MRDLNSIVSANADSFIPQQTVKITVGQLEALHKALGTATASLVDVLKYGTNRNQRSNINNSDLPVIGRATKLAAGLLAQVEKGFVGAFSYTDQWGNQIDLGPGIVTTRALTEEEKGDWAKKHANIAGTKTIDRPWPMETRLDRPLTGADSPYAEERAQARFDAIEDARVSAKAQEAAQEAADNAPTPTVLRLECVTSPYDTLAVTRRASAGGFQFRIQEQDETLFLDIYPDDVDQMCEWLSEVIEAEEDDPVAELNLDCAGIRLIGAPYGYENKADLSIRGGVGPDTKLAWVTLDTIAMEQLLEFLNA